MGVSALLTAPKLVVDSLKVALAVEGLARNVVVFMSSSSCMGFPNVKAFDSFLGGVEGDVMDVFVLLESSSVMKLFMVADLLVDDIFASDIMEIFITYNPARIEVKTKAAEVIVIV